MEYREAAIIIANQLSAGLREHVFYRTKDQAQLIADAMSAVTVTGRWRPYQSKDGKWWLERVA